MGVIETYTGQWVDPYHLDSKLIKIEDIAHSLSLKCRFSGHCSDFYSVAEHSVAVAKLVPVHLRFSALLHDAHEAYTGDTATPNKFPALEALEKYIQYIIDTVFSTYISKEENLIIKQADNDMKATEAYYLMKSKGLSDYWAPIKGKVIRSSRPVLLSSKEAEQLFLYHFKRYRRSHAASLW